MVELEGRKERNLTINTPSTRTAKSAAPSSRHFLLPVMANVGTLGNMTKKILPFIFGSAAANIFMIIGVVLLCLTLYFGVNPADGSVVNPLVRGTWIHIFLFITTIPALMVMLVAGDDIVGFALMFFMQTCVFWTLGRVWVFIFSSITQQKGKNGS